MAWNHDLGIASTKSGKIDSFCRRAVYTCHCDNVECQYFGYISENNTRDRPYTLISCSPDESHNVSGEREVTQMLTDGKETGVMIRLGSINSDHFQSLIVNDTKHQYTTPVNEPSLSCSVLKSPCKNTTSTTSNTIPSINNQTKPSYVARKTALKNKCEISNVSYDPPKPSETTSDTELRRRLLPRACNKKAKSCTKITNPATLSTCSSPPKKMPCLSPQSAKINVTVNGLDNTSTQNVSQQNMMVQKIMASINLGAYTTKVTKPRTESKSKKTTLDVTSKKGNSFIAKEQAIKEKCNLLKIPYEAPKANETSAETKKRRQRLTRQCKNLLLKTTNNCTNVKPVPVPTNYNLPQMPPVFPPETTNNPTNIPPRLLQPPLTLPITTENLSNIATEPMITNKHNSNLPQTLPVIPPITAENLTNIPPNLPQPPVTPPINAQNQSNIVNEPMITNQSFPAELSSFHPNEDDVTAILRFEEGEMQHGINTCKTCLETRPVFHVTPPINKPGNNETAPVLLKPWEICNDGRCQKCHTESLSRARKHVRVAAKFSGAFSGGWSRSWTSYAYHQR